MPLHPPYGPKPGAKKPAKPEPPELQHLPGCWHLKGRCHCAETAVRQPSVAEGVSLSQEIESFLTTLPGYLIEPDAMEEILEILHAPQRVIAKPA